MEVVDNVTQVAPTQGNVDAGQMAAVSDWRSGLDEGLRADPSLAKFKDIGGLAKSYKSLEGLLGKDKVVVPKEGDSQEVWDMFYKANGRPDAADKYDFKVPESLGIEPEVVNGYKSVFHKLGLNNAQVQTILDERAKEMAIYAEREAEKDKASVNEAITTLRKELGDKYEPNMANAQALFKKFASESMQAYAVKTGIANHPEFAKFMMSIAKVVGPDAMVNGASISLTPQTAASEIAKIKAGPAYYDANHPENAAAKQRVRDLIEVAEG